MNLTSIHYLHEIGSKKTQEDYLWPEPGSATLQDRIFIVCDGVGGSQNGEVASKIIADYVGNALKTAPPDFELNKEIIVHLLQQAKEKLITFAFDNSLNHDMATTLSLLVLQEEKAFIAWCGDSRVYHIRNGKICYQTEDHSLVHTLIKNGEITEEEAQNHPHKNIILHAIKADESEIEITVHTITDVKNGDYFLLCTDGLLEQISAAELESAFTDLDSNGAGLDFWFRSKCFEKTRDNYSMYLLITGKEKKPSSNNIILFMLLFLLLSLGVVLYFIQK